MGEAGSAPRSVLRVQVLDRWATERDGATIALGSNEAPLLHALVLAPDEGISRADLRRVLEQPNHVAKQTDDALRNTLRKLRGEKNGVKIAGSDPLMLVRPQARLVVDLWEFLSLVKRQRYAEANDLLAGRDKLAVPVGVNVDASVWREVLDDFATAKAKVEQALSASSERVRVMLRSREELLSGRPVPGFEPSASIHSLRESLEPIPLAWHVARSREAPESPLPPVGDYIAETLLHPSDAPNQMIVAGPPGSGKALTAIATYVRLTDCLLDPDKEDHGRTVLYVDARREASNRAFGTDRWLAEQLAAAGGDAAERPIVVMTHGDAFLSANETRLVGVLNSRLFRDTDLLLCCNEQFYVKTLAHYRYGTHEIRLDDWGPELQRRYVRALYGQDVCDRFEEWRDLYESREVICRSPLHLNYVAYLIATNDAEFQTIERRWQLFSRIAAARMRSTGSKKMKAALMDDLGSIAHRFFHVERPISFSEEDLLEDLQRRGIPNPEKRVSALIEHTVLDSPIGGDELRFEDLLWGWFFVAHRLYRTVTNQELGPEDLLHAFEKLFSPAVMGRCEEMLRDWPELHEILDPLRRALEHSGGRTVLAGRRRLAREQVGYFLGALADADLQAVLEAAVDLQAGPLEADELVRRGIVIGLSSKGAAGIADSYVESLREEVAGDGPTPAADLNVAFVLGFRGDRDFDPEKPHIWGADPDPARTVFGLIRALENKRHFGTWRIKLFTLVDLGERVTPDRFAERVLEHRQRLLATLDRLAADPATESWPEIAEMRLILNDGRREDRRRDTSGAYQGPERRSGDDRRVSARSI